MRRECGGVDLLQPGSSESNREYFHGAFSSSSLAVDGLLLSSSSSLFDDDDDDDDDASAFDREKKDASYLLRVLMMCEMDDACCHARERKMESG